MPGSDLRETAIDKQFDSGDIAAVVGCEKHNRKLHLQHDGGSGLSASLTLGSNCPMVGAVVHTITCNN